MTNKSRTERPRVHRTLVITARHLHVSLEGAHTERYLWAEADVVVGDVMEE